MMRELRISSAAEVDVAESWDYYRVEEPGLELDFIECVEKAIPGSSRPHLRFPLFSGLKHGGR